LDEKIYASWDYDLRFFVRQQNLSERWGELKNAFQAEFRDYITGLINEDAPNNAMPPTAK
jgi:hypothetical protein